MDTTNSTSNSTETHRHTDGSGEKNILLCNVWCVTFWFLTDLVNIANNIIIIMVIYKQNKMKSSPSKLYVNQAAADGGVGIMSSVMLLYTLFSNSEIGTVEATIFRVFVVMAYSESLQSIGMTGITLCVAVWHPMKFKLYNTTRSVVVFIIASWTFNIATGCLIFTAGDYVVNIDFMLFSFHRVQDHNVWYEVLKLSAIFTLPLVSILLTVRLWIFHKAQQKTAHVGSISANLIRQSFGVFIMICAYVVVILALILYENSVPVTVDNFTSTMASTVIMYMYFVLKLPLFLLVFKPYRQVAKSMFCPCRARNRIQPTVTQQDERVMYVVLLLCKRICSLCSSHKKLKLYRLGTIFKGKSIYEVSMLLPIMWPCYNVRTNFWSAAV